jgi:hypothetical protein
VWIRTADAEVLVDLAAHFAGAGYFVRVGATHDTLEVGHPGALTSDEARRQIEMHVNACQAMYPSGRIELLPEDPAPA